MQEQEVRTAIPEKKDQTSRLLVRAIAVLEFIAQADAPQGVRELSAKAKLPATTVYRIVQTLCQLGWLVQTADAKFRIGMGAYRVGNKYDQIKEISEIAPYTMQKLSDELQQPVNLMVRDKGEVLLIAQTACRTVYNTVSPVGSRRPMYLTGCGKVMMSDMTPTEVELLLDSFEYRPYTPYSPLNKETVLKQLAEVRQKGWALDGQETMLGAFCVATGIRHEGRVIAGLSVASVLAYEHCIDHYAQCVKRAAAEIQSNYRQYLQELKSRDLR